MTPKSEEHSHHCMAMLLHMQGNQGALQNKLSPVKLLSAQRLLCYIKINPAELPEP